MFPLIKKKEILLIYVIGHFHFVIIYPEWNLLLFSTLISWLQKEVI